MHTPPRNATTGLFPQESADVANTALTTTDRPGPLRRVQDTAMIPSPCGKVPYPNPVTAWRALRALTRKTALFHHKKRHKRCTAYPCEHCHHWHITQQRRDRPADWPQRRAAGAEREWRT